MADGQRVIRDETLREHPLVALASFFRLREVVGEVRANKFLARRPGDLHGGLVHVRDFAFRADRDQRVHAGFDQASGVLGQADFIRDILRDQQKTDRLAGKITAWRDHHARGELVAIFPLARKRSFPFALLQRRPHDLLVYSCRDVLGCMQDRGIGPADDFIGLVAVQAARALIPNQDLSREASIRWTTREYW